MPRFVLRRLSLVLPSLFGLLVVTFLLIRVVPSDPRRRRWRARTRRRRRSPPSARSTASTGRSGSSSSSISSQVARLDFGDCAYSGRPVARDIAQRLPATLELTFCRAGARDDASAYRSASWRRLSTTRWPDYLLRVVTVGGIAVAAFWFAIMLQLLFAMDLEWLPLRGELAVGIGADPRASPASCCSTACWPAGCDIFAERCGTSCCRPSPSRSAASPPSPASRGRACSTRCRRTSCFYERAMGYRRAAGLDLRAAQLGDRRR